MIKHTLYVSDTGQPVDEKIRVRVLDNTTTRIQYNLAQCGIPNTTLKLGVQTPAEIAFVILTALNSTPDVLGNSLQNLKKKPMVVGFNCAPRSGGAKLSAQGEPLIYLKIEDNEFVGYGREIISYILGFLQGNKTQNVLLLNEYGPIKNTSKDTQFRSLNYLIPLIADLTNISELSRQEILEKNKNTIAIIPKEIPDFAFFEAEEFLNNHVVLLKEKWEKIPMGQRYKLTLGDNIFRVTKIDSITDIDEGEIGLWESSSKIGSNHVVLDLAYKRNVSKNDINKFKSISLTKLLNKFLKAGDSLESYLVPTDNENGKEDDTEYFDFSRMVDKHGENSDYADIMEDYLGDYR